MCEPAGLSNVGVAFRLSRFSVQYRKRLIDGLKNLQKYCRLVHGRTIEAVVSKPKTVDILLGEYVLYRFNESNKGLSVVKHALLACQHVYPHLKGKLQVSWSNLKTWEEQRVAHLRPPIPVPIWLLALGLARAHAKLEANPKSHLAWKTFGVLLEIGLLCMLRPGELLNLTQSDVSLPGSFVMSRPYAALCITSPKNRRQFGTHQFVLLKHPNAINSLATIVEEGKTTTLWPLTAREFGNHFKMIMQELGVSSMKLTPASLRAGGATMFYNRGIAIGTLRFMGRWTVEKSLEHYLQLAMSTQIINRLDGVVISRLKKLAPMCLLHVLCNGVLNIPLERLPGRRATAIEITNWCDNFVSLA